MLPAGIGNVDDPGIRLVDDDQLMNVVARVGSFFDAGVLRAETEPGLRKRRECAGLHALPFHSGDDPKKPRRCALNSGQRLDEGENREAREQESHPTTADCPPTTSAPRLSPSPESRAARMTPATVTTVAPM